MTAFAMARCIGAQFIDTGESLRNVFFSANITVTAILSYFITNHDVLRDKLYFLQ